jgi:hypothetical protein
MHFIYFIEYHLAGVMIKSPEDELIQFETRRLFIDISMYSIGHNKLYICRNKTIYIHIATVHYTVGRLFPGK